jgi:hypothetical protein
LITSSDPPGHPLAQKLLLRPDVLQQLHNAIQATDDAYLECFVSTDAERDLAYALDVPLYGPDPALTRFGLKSQSRALFSSLGIPIPQGIEGVRGFDELVRALADLKREQPLLARAVVKLDDSLGGVGNAVFSYAGCPDPSRLTECVRGELENRLELAMDVLDRDRFLQRISQRECVVESYVEGDRKRSPSVQCQIRPEGKVLIASTHEQHLTGPVGQHFSGCSLPAEKPGGIQQASRLIATRLRREGVIGWFGVDFVVVEEDAGTRLYAIEINLRTVGTAHHLMMLRSLTGGDYDPTSGLFLTSSRQARFYFGSDSVVVPEAVGLDPADLLPRITDQTWAYRASSEIGVVFHMVDAVKQYGRIGMTCIGRSPR